MFIIHTSQLIQPFRKIFMDLLIKLFSKSLVRCFVAPLPPSIAPRTLIRCAYTFEWQTQENKMEMQMKSRFLIPSKQTEFRSFFVCYCFANIIRTFVLLSVLREMSNSSLSCAVAMVCQFISCFHITCSSIPNIIATNSIHIYGYKSSDQIQLN